MLTSQTEFRNYCLRKLGEPVIKVNLDQTQIDDAIDDAIEKFNHYHEDGYEEYFYLYTIPAPATAGGQPSRKVSLDQTLEIDDVIEVVPAGGIDFGGRFDTYAWQAGAAITSPQTGGWANIQLQDYVAMTQRLHTLNDVLGPEYPLSFNRYKREITLKFPISEGEQYAFKTYRRVNPQTAGNEDAWNNMWLKEYATALIKLRWGNVLSKVSGVKLVGGIELNGAEILRDAQTEIERLEEQLKLEHQLPPDIFIG